MPQPNKIVTYGLEKRCLELSAIPGMTDITIAEQLNEELDGAGSVSPSAVSRYRRAKRFERAEQSKAIVQDHIQVHMPADLDALEEVETFWLRIFRNQKPDMVAGNLVAGEYSDAVRGDAGMKAKQVIETKLKFSGVLDDPNKEAAAAKKAQELLDELSPDLRGKAKNAFGAGSKKEGVSGPH